MQLLSLNNDASNNRATLPAGDAIAMTLSQSAKIAGFDPQAY